LIGSNLKRGIRKNNTDPFQAPKLIELVKSEIDITAEEWYNCVQHVKKIETTFVKTPPMHIEIQLGSGDWETSSEEVESNVLENSRQCAEVGSDNF
jgi:hypothetical protein